ncbi:SRPBCC domain-containing protein [Sphingosinicella terrae]|uniref:SRPBCC domain-containing protein n=1 Tax=Sphingosinicella terrae TaxID=2172047 RepID=UPI0025487908|nr:SRPBCC domain-containing protein [Sphingosinicella terrae]
MKAIAGTIELERHYPAPVGEVFAAWSSAEAMQAWSAMPPGWSMRCDAFALEVDHQDVWRFGPADSAPFVNGNRYVLIEPDRHISYSTTLSHEGRMQFVGAVSATFETDGAGCRLNLIEVGVHLGEDDREGHRDGWNAMLDALGHYLGARTAVAASSG